MKSILQTTQTLLAVAIIFSGAVLVSAWTIPVTPAPGGGVYAPINATSFGQSKQGNLLILGVDALNQPYQNSLIVANGNVGVGTDVPQQKLSVYGVLGVRDICITDNLGNITGPCLSGGNSPIVSGSSGGSVAKITIKSQTAGVGSSLKCFKSKDSLELVCQ